MVRFRDKLTHHMEWRHLLKNGEVRNVEVYSGPVVIQGKTLLFSVLHDITERNKLEARLIESENKFRNIFEAASDGIFLQDATGFIDCSEKGACMYGLTRVEVIGRSPADLAPERQPDGRLSAEVATEKITAVLAGKPQQFEWRSLRADRVSFDVEITLNRIELGGSVCLQAVVRDITERKRTELQLIENELRYRTLADSGQALIWTSGTDKLCDYFNKVWLEFTGRSMEQEIGNGWAEGVHPDDFQHCLDVYVSSFDRREKFGMDYRLRRHDGEYRWIRDEGCPRYNSKGEFIGYIGFCIDITERKQTELKLQLAASVFTHAREGIAITDAKGTIIDINETFSIITGYGRDDAIGRNPRILSSGRQGKEFYIAMWRDLTEKGNWTGEIWNRHKNGYDYAEILTISAVRDANGNTQQYVALFSDITERRRREESLRLAATVFETVDQAVLITDTENKIITVNPAFTNITGYTKDEVVGKNPHVLSSGRHPPEFYQELWGTLTSTGSWHGEVWNRRKPGDVYVEQLSIHMVRDEQGHLTHHVGTFSDISERKAAEEHVQHMAHYDLLTDLPNRALITDRIRQTLIKAKRNKERMALMFLDLDEFKPVNDRLGHAIGDLLLQEVAKRLLHCVRESDTVARIGGDEFVILLPVIEGEQDAMVVAEKIQHALINPFDLSGHTVSISVSIGIAIYPDHGNDEKTLIKNADIAMYHAKHSGHRNTKIYQAGIPKSNE